MSGVGSGARVFVGVGTFVFVDVGSAARVFVGPGTRVFVGVGGTPSRTHFRPSCHTAIRRSREVNRPS